MMEQPICMKLACWLAGEAKEGGAQGLGLVLRTQRVGCPTGCVIIHLLVQLQSVPQSSSEVTADRWVWGQRGTCSLQAMINVVGVLEQPSRRKLAGS